ncbi:methylated-DNA--[protein]-cysteine S-methyltransferase [Candidatus Nitrotoga sp. 1052]|uniref:methylated-DNA--[protein]-cysteine S-methyltransferase n=1 Tax=Candidatus Nitrotoga sp. 1052 TaxID=2886964 RepID=UPI001EF54518|nr:methylated-DNA--[protein]-cysteine S-methyltransferase [Candidatus Nitrotoga sp. 1052]CAH1083941.1 Methylated-DNA--protein-cysteine methyltransferase [Candidatus Nitrotoga sp. 1052]
MNYQAKLPTPFGMLGIRCEADALTGIDFLEPGATPQPPSQACAREVCEQLQAYFIDPNFHFNLSLKLNGTTHQTKVWQAISAIPSGQTRNYGDLATLLGSSPRAVGQACGANPIPIVIPCHRVVSKSGIGGFIHQRGGDALDIKCWLLAYEEQSNQGVCRTSLVTN